MTTTAKISDAAVKKATGCTWERWCTALDRAGCRDMSHKEIVAAVGKISPKLDGWWRQMVTVGYEQARGLREKHQKPDGWSISVSRTIGVPVGDLFKAFKDTRTRRRWLDLAAPGAGAAGGADIVIRKATLNKSLRITWADGATHVEVNLSRKGPGKSQVALQHDKLSSAKAAAAKKKYWAGQLDGLKGMLGKE